MGMIIRVRGRLRSFHTLPKLQPEERNEKIAEIVCLLSVLFLLPYCSRGHAPLLFSLGGWCLATYSFLVLPVLYQPTTSTRCVGSGDSARKSW
ncbi:hypothetical protein JTB14_030365 [Gonioctena quinquepunctata]|nr:hypothetical protein JTB14_030365 [Gonioctena quinquepunctata]